MARRFCARTMSRRQCKRCASPPQSRPRDERQDFHQGAVAARLSWRHAVRGQGRADVHHRPELDIDLAAAARTDKVVDTVSYDKVVECVSTAFCAQKYRLIEAAAGRAAD